MSTIFAKIWDFIMAIAVAAYVGASMYPTCCGQTNTLQTIGELMACIPIALYALYVLIGFFVLAIDGI
jgi:hypothetical protein